jgi:N,N'-diacetyllegionaminate synthase
MEHIVKKLPYLVCELANSHGGDETILTELIHHIGELSYPKKAIKFQVFQADKIAQPDYEWFQVYEKLQLSEGVWTSLIDRAAAVADVWIDVFDVYSMEVVRKNLRKITGLKLQASVLENQEILSELASIDLDSKTLVINISGYELDDIARFVTIFENFSKNLVLQLGFQAYPTAISDTALQKIGVLKAAFPSLALGIADHADATTGFALLAPVYANILGCSYIEKHLCLDRKTAKYDAFSALIPSEMKNLCLLLLEAVHARDGFFVGASEKAYLEKSVQIPSVRSSISPGALIATSDLLFRRTARPGLSWSQIADIQRSRKIVKQEINNGITVLSENFRPAKIAAIVACRMKSSRLPKKATIPIAGISSVERCLSQCLATKGLDEVILATSTLGEDSVLAQYLFSDKVQLWRGDPDDVISRYLGACDKYAIDVIVRVTADCPLILPEILEFLLEKHFDAGADYTAAEACAVGTSGEIINASALRKVLAHFGSAPHSEYMTWYFKNNPDVFKVNIVELPTELVRPYRMTLDYPEDLEMFEAVYAALDMEKLPYTAHEVFGVIDRSPEISMINSHIELKYVSDQSLIDTLNKQTRMQF